ncbi:MAG: nucleoside triphosphate pyrophosphohydrolase [Spirochaetes bacterium]|nr:MAG: nucleoside triphosphate pyrophosphohydrolase [Spirochaetota bacterium]
MSLQSFYELVRVMERLRAENGCPWDRKQTHESLKPYLIEETYEVISAIDSGNDDELKEELGDLLLQIVFHAQIAKEDGRFDIDDVAKTIVEKLIRRHPHVFGDLKVSGSDEVLQNWEKIKKEEGKESIFDGVPEGLPSLLKARRVQEKAKRVGFDWNNIEGTLDKVKEEFDELSEAIKFGKKEKISEEFGDLLFSLVNVSRFLDIDAEDSLRQTIEKFMKRFKSVEKIIKSKGGKDLKNYTINELDEIWEDVKRREKKDE